MICRETEDWLLERLAGTLSTHRGDELDAHLKVCAACRRTASRLKLSVRDLQNAFATLEPPDLTASVLRRVQRPEPVLWGRLAPAFAGGALALCLALAFFLGSRPGLSDQELIQAYSEDLTAVSGTLDESTDWPTTEVMAGLDGLPESLF
jgi:anti-sigma factor RsiW